MLTSLRIKNYALIDELIFEPGSSFTTITGETGAGKSIVLGALSLILGARADMGVLRDSSKKCTVEGWFSLSEVSYRSLFEEHDLDWDSPAIIRRELSPTGKSRAFINDTPVTLDVLRQITSQVVQVHTQSETRDIESTQFKYLFFQSDTLDLYRIKYMRYRNLLREQETLKNEMTEWARENEFYRFLHKELDEAKFYEDEAQQLEDELDRLENREEITENLNYATSIFENEEAGVLENLRKIRLALQKLASLSSHFEEYTERFNEAETELRELAADLAIAGSDMDTDPTDANRKRERLDLLNGLMDKHRVQSLVELQAVAEDIKGKIQNADSREDEIQRLDTEIQELETELNKVAEALHEERFEKANRIAENVLDGIQQLGMPNAQFHIDIVKEDTLNANGKNRIEFMFSANKGIPSQPLAKVASGGEKSRLVLVLKSILASEKQLPTLIFDEIDTGVSGEIAGKMGRRMSGMAETTQLIAITHLPQVAAFGANQFKVIKQSDENSTTTQMIELDQYQRIDEIAQMLSGEKVTDTAKKAAEELLNLN